MLNFWGMMDRPSILAMGGVAGVGVAVGVGSVVGEGKRVAVGCVGCKVKSSTAAVGEEFVVGTAVSVGRAVAAIAVGAAREGRSGAGSAVGKGVVTNASIGSGMYWRTRPGSAAAACGNTRHTPKATMTSITRIRPGFANLLTISKHCNKAADNTAIAARKP